MTRWDIGLHFFSSPGLDGNLLRIGSRVSGPE